MVQTPYGSWHAMAMHPEVDAWVLFEIDNYNGKILFNDSPGIGVFQSRTEALAMLKRVTADVCETEVRPVAQCQRDIA